MGVFKWWFAVMTAVAACCALVIWWNWAPPAKVEPIVHREVEEKPSPEPLVSLAEALELQRLRNLAVGYLENSTARDLWQANLEALYPILEELKQRRPRDPFVTRNAAIARLQHLDWISTDETQEAARQAIAAMLKAEPESPAACLLAGLYYRSQNLLEQAEHHFELAMRHDEENAPAYYLFAVCREELTGDPISTRGYATLVGANRLLPNNLEAIAHLLVLQAEHKQRDLFQSIENARPVFRVFAPRSDADLASGNHRYQLPGMLDEIKTLAENGQWEDAQIKAIMLRNVLRAQNETKTDLKQLDPHPLSLMLYDFVYPLTDDEFPQTAQSKTFQLVYQAWDMPGLPQPAGLRQAAAVDFDLDGTLDLVLLLEKSVEVWTRGGLDAPWRLAASLELPGDYTGMLAEADLDWDSVGELRAIPEAGRAPDATQQRLERGRGYCAVADVDLVLYGPAGLLMLRNDLTDAATNARSLTVVPQPDLGPVGAVSAAVLVDLNHDGDLDLATVGERGVQFFRAGKALDYSPISHLSQRPAEPHPWTAIVPVDVDNDLDVDLILAGPGAPTVVLENLLHSQFRSHLGLATWGQLEGAATVQVLDVDGDEYWDYLSAGSQGVRMLRTTRLPDDSVGVRSASVISSDAVLGAIAFDCDNDGFDDLLSWTAEGAALLRGLVGEQAGKPAGGVPKLFDVVPMPTVAQIPPGVSQLIPGDVDGDGDLDLVAVHGGKLSLFENRGGERQKSISVRLAGINRDGSRDGSRVNYNGLGSLLELRSADLHRRRFVRRQSTHFGLGVRDGAHVIRVVWPNGVPQAVVNPPAPAILCEPEQIKGSCPYLYSWDGEKFVFVTDLLWGAPIGMIQADGQVAPWRAWEHLKLPGTALRARDGKYVLQVTEELWEATYFDAIRLTAVDHPADVEIHTNEKVGPPELAEHRIHTARRPRPPVSAVDQKGRDLLPIVLDADGVYTPGYEFRHRQGLTETHFVEFDLGELDAPQRVLLFLRGWMYPGDTSLSLAHSENASLPPVRPLELWAPDAAGEWKLVRPFIGFPGGKTKTIVVDVSDLVAAGTRKLRLVTNLELHWDQIRFTVDEEPAEFVETPLPLLSADLHYRGRSHRVWPGGHGPDNYLYDQVDAEPFWPPMRGRFTRFGDVRELLADVDDRLVVIGAGDEMTLEFAVPETPLPPGWVRDFVIFSHGWDKDADLNTLAGQSAEPYPFNAMRHYPFDPAPDRPEILDWIERYQTREQSRHDFWRKLRPPPVEVRGP